MGVALEVGRPLRRRGGGSRSFAWAVASQGASSATNLALTLLAGRVLGPHGLGTIFVGFACYLLALGFQRALLTDPLVTSSAALDSGPRGVETGSALTLCVLGALAASALVAAVGAAVSGGVGRGLLLFAPFLLPALLQDFWRVVLFRDGRGAAGACNDALWLLVMGAIAPLAVLSGASWAVAACWGAGAAAGACAGVLQTGTRPERIGDALAWWRGKAWSLGRWLGAEGILWAVTSYATIFVLAGLVGARGLGGLRAVQTLFAPLALLGPAVSLPGLPALSRELGSSAEAARRLAARVALGVAGVAVAYASVLALGGDTALRLVFGAPFAGFADLVWPLGAVQILAAAPVGFALLLKAQRRGRALVLARGVGLVASLSTVWALATVAGLRGAAWGLAAGALVGALALTWLATRPPPSHASSPLGTIALRLFRLLSPSVYRRLRAAPLIGAVLRRVLDLVLPSRGPVPLRVAGGPLQGLVVELDPRLHKEMLSGRFEPQIQRTIQELLSEGDTAFDVGAHLGYFSLSMATRVGGSGHVVAFEPNPSVAERLRRNVVQPASSLGSIVTPVATALGAQSGRLPFASGADSSTGRLSPDGDLDVEVTTLDEVAERFGEPRLVKIDVEGAEVDVLRGGRRLIARRFAAFVIEAHSEHLEQACVRLLESLGYRCGRIQNEPGGTAHLLARPTEAEGESAPPLNCRRRATCH
jgi:FkbM family methyltransferase